MPRRLRKSPAAIFRLYIELLEIEPVIWRKVLVDSDVKLSELHHILNEAMGWTDSHLHQFILRDRVFGDPRTDVDGDDKFEDERKFHLDKIVGVGQHLVYEYDFGDDWCHHVQVEKRLDVDHRVAYPLRWRARVPARGLRRPECLRAAA
jgi:hypothetical protein